MCMRSVADSRSGRKLDYRWSEFCQRRLTGSQIRLCCGSKVHFARFSEPCQEQMEVDQASIRMPSTDRALHSLVVQRSFETQPRCQPISGSHIISRKRVGSPEAAQQDVFCRPPAHPVQTHQLLDCDSVVTVLELFRHKVSCDDFAGESEQKTCFAVAESQAAKGRRLRSQQILRAGKCVLPIIGEGQGWAALHRDSAQEFDSHGQRELLTSNGIRQGFENRGKPRRLETSKSFG